MHRILQMEQQTQGTNSCPTVFPMGKWLGGNAGDLPSPAAVFQARLGSPCFLKVIAYSCHVAAGSPNV